MSQEGPQCVRRSGSEDNDRRIRGQRPPGAEDFRIVGTGKDADASETKPVQQGLFTDRGNGLEHLRVPCSGLADEDDGDDEAVDGDPFRESDHNHGPTEDFRALTHRGESSRPGVGNGKRCAD
jgi:hypothetical protein